MKKALPGLGHRLGLGGCGGDEKTIQPRTAPAPAAVRAAADEVAPSNGDDGWAVVLEREFLA